MCTPWLFLTNFPDIKSSCCSSWSIKSDLLSSLGQKSSLASSTLIKSLVIHQPLCSTKLFVWLGQVVLLLPVLLTMGCTIFRKKKNCWHLILTIKTRSLHVYVYRCMYTVHYAEKGHCLEEFCTNFTTEASSDKACASLIVLDPWNSAQQRQLFKVIKVVSGRLNLWMSNITTIFHSHPPFSSYVFVFGCLDIFQRR